MLGGCLFSSNFTMTADIYKKLLTKTATGSMEESWVLYNSVGNNGKIRCNVSTFASASFRLQATTQIIGDKYKDLEFLLLYSLEKLPNNIRITNIQDANSGEHLFTEIELAGNPDTRFNTSGSTPVFDPFGKIIQYENTIHRAENQVNA